MKTNNPIKPTDGELEILQVLWKLSSATVRQVNDELNQAKEVGYTTTLKLMQIMTEKGLLTRQKDGKTHIYQAAVSEEGTQQQIVDKLLETAFKGAASKLVMQALGNKKSTPEELKQIREYLNKLEKGGEA